VLAVLYVLDVLYISSSQRVKEMSKRKTIDFLEQEVDIQSYANAHFNGDFTAAVRHMVRKFLSRPKVGAKRND
jgi:hypothetical protein